MFLAEETIDGRHMARDSRACPKRGSQVRIIDCEVWATCRSGSLYDRPECVMSLPGPRPLRFKTAAAAGHFFPSPFDRDRSLFIIQKAASGAHADDTITSPRTTQFKIRSLVSNNASVAFAYPQRFCSLPYSPILP